MAPNRSGPRIAVARASSPTPSVRSSHSFLDEDPYASTSPRHSYDGAHAALPVAPVTTAELLKRLENLLASKANEIQLAGTLGESLLTQQSILEARIAEFAEVVNAGAVCDPTPSDQRRARGGGAVSDEEEKQVGEETRRRLEALEAEMHKWDESNSPLYQVVGMAVHEGLPTNEDLVGAVGSSTVDSPPRPPRNVVFPGPPPPSLTLNSLSQSLGPSPSADANGTTPNAAASRRARNNAQHRNNDIELATEIGQSLLGEVRRLQSLLAEKEELMREGKEEKDALERDLENSNEARKTVEESLEKYKEENWNLELATQEMRTSLIDAQSSVQKAELDRGRVLKDLATNRDLLEAQRSESEKLLAQLEALKARHETDMATMRKHSAGLQREKSDLTTSLEAAKAELAVRARGIRKVGSPTTNLSMLEQMETEAQREEDEDDVFGTVGRRKTGEGYPNAASDLFSEFGDNDSPDSSRGARGAFAGEGPEMHQAAMAHAQKTIATLRASLAREKAAKMELKKQVMSGGGGFNTWEEAEPVSSPDGTPYRQTPSRSTRGSARGRGSARRRGGAVGVPSRLGNEFAGDDDSIGEEEILDSFAPAGGEDSASIFEHQFPLVDADETSESGTDDYDSPIRHAKRVSMNDLDPTFASGFDSPGSDVESSLGSDRAHVTTLAAALGRSDSVDSPKSARPTSAMFADSTNFYQSSLSIGVATPPRKSVDHLPVATVPAPEYVDVELQTSPDPELRRMEDELEAARKEIATSSLVVEEKETALAALVISHAAALVASSKESESRTRTIKEEHATDLDTLRHQYDTILETNKAAHSGQIATIAEQHRRDLDSKLSALSAKHDAALASMATSHEASIRDLVATHSNDITSLSSRHSVVLFDLQAAHKEAIADLISSHSASVVELQSSHEKTVGDVELRHEKSIKALQSQHETTIGNLQASHQDSTKELQSTHQAAFQGLKSSHEEIVQNLINSHQATLASERESHHEALSSLAEGHAIALPVPKQVSESYAQTDPLPSPPVVVRPQMEDRGLITDPLLATPASIPADLRSLSTLEPRRMADEVGSDTAGETDTEFEDARETAASPVPRTDYTPSAASFRDFASVKTHRTNDSGGSAVEVLKSPAFPPLGRHASPLRPLVADAQVQTEHWNSGDLISGTTTPIPKTSALYDPKRDSINTFGRSDELESAAAAASAFLLNSSSQSIPVERAQSPDDVFRPESAFSSFSQKSDSILLPPQTPSGKGKGPAVVSGPMAPPPPPSRSRGPTPRKSAIGSSLAPPRPTSPPPPDLLYRAQSPMFDGDLDRRVLSVPATTRSGSSSLPPPPRTPGASQQNLKAQSLRPYPSMTSELQSSKSQSRNRRGQSSAVSITSSVRSGASRRMSVASSQTSDGGYDPVPVRAANDSTDPAVIHAITQTMIGEFLHKYTRRTIGKGLSEKRHQRFFWVHPYTKTLYWSSEDPGASKTNQSSAKSVFIEGVRQVLDPNPFPPGLYQGSIIVKTPNREIQFTAPTRERHDMWFNAINYLLARPEPAPAPSPALGTAALPQGTPSRYGMPSPRAGLYSLTSLSDSRLLTPRSNRINKSSTMTSKRRGTAADEYTRRGTANDENGLSSPKSMRTMSDFEFFRGDESVEVVDGSQIPHVHDENDEFEGLENVRACCDGKHDVGSLSRRHNHFHNRPHSDREGQTSTSAESTPIARKRSKSSITTWGRQKSGTVNSSTVTSSSVAPSSMETPGRKNSFSAA